MVQYPDERGAIYDYRELAAKAASTGITTAVAADCLVWRC
jgi:glycine cleavage system pyridoxal-binding protein P